MASTMRSPLDIVGVEDTQEGKSLPLGARHATALSGPGWGAPCCQTCQAACIRLSRDWGLQLITPYGRGRLIAAIYGQLSLPSILNSLHNDDNIASAGASEAKIRMGTYFNNLAATWVPEFFFASCHFASRIERNWSSLRLEMQWSAGGAPSYL